MSFKVLSLLSLIGSATAINITPSNVALSLWNAMFKITPGINHVVLSATYSGSVDSSGTFLYSNLPGLSRGTILSTGKALDSQISFNRVAPPKHPANIAFGPGHPLCHPTSTSATAYDASVLSVQFASDAMYLQGNFALTTEEAHWGPDDIMHIYVDGISSLQDISHPPGQHGVPLSVNSVSTSQWIPTPDSGLAYRYTTPVVTSRPIYLSKGTHTIHVLVCDIQDKIYDSAALISLWGCSGSMGCDPPLLNAGSIINSTTVAEAAEELTSGIIDFASSTSASDELIDEPKSTDSRSTEKFSEGLNPTTITIEHRATPVSNGSFIGRN